MKVKKGDWLIVTSDIWGSDTRGAFVLIGDMARRGNYRPAIFYRLNGTHGDGVVFNATLPDGHNSKYWNSYRRATKLEILEAKLLGRI